MENLIDLESRKDEKLRLECERLRSRIKRLETLRGYIQREDGRSFILQGVKPSFEIWGDDYTTNLNHFIYSVDNQLIIDGWNPCGSISLDENYFKQRKKTLSNIGWSNIREERSEYRDSGKPCAVIYGKR